MGGHERVRSGGRMCCGGSHGDRAGWIGSSGLKWITEAGSFLVMMAFGMWP